MNSVMVEVIYFVVCIFVIFPSYIYLQRQFSDVTIRDLLGMLIGSVIPFLNIVFLAILLPEDFWKWDKKVLFKKIDNAN